MQALFPARAVAAMPEGAEAMGDSAALAQVLIAAGYRDPVIESVTHDYLLDVDALSEPDKAFGMSTDYSAHDQSDREAVFIEVRRRADGRSVLPIA